MPHINITMSGLEKACKRNFRRATGWQPIGVLSAPGVGKTQFTKHVLPQIYADYLGLPVEDIGFYDFKPANYDAQELAGPSLPYKNPESGVITFQPTQSFIARSIEESGEEFGVLLVDELAAAPHPEQKVCADLLDPNEHSIGGWGIPAGWIVFFTGNRAQDKAGSGRLLSHLPSRCKVFNLLFSIADLRKWWMAEGHNPIVIECAEAYADQKFFAEAVPTEDSAYCTPRSLVNAAIDLDAFLADPEEDFTGTIPMDMEQYLGSSIGPSAANVLCQWISRRDHIPTAAEILADPDHAQVPDQTGYQMVAANIAMGAIDPNDEQTAINALHYIVRLRTDLQVSLGTKLLKIATHHGWYLNGDKTAAAFNAKFHSLLPLAFGSQI